MELSFFLHAKHRMEIQLNIIFDLHLTKKKKLAVDRYMHPRMTGMHNKIIQCLWIILLNGVGPIAEWKFSGLTSKYSHTTSGLFFLKFLL